MDINNLLDRLAKSKFRNSFHLKEKDINYLKEKGHEVIKSHARDFINKNERIKLDNDGKQTPTKGHPIFIGQHACALCCRACIRKWYHIPEDKELTDEQVKYFVDVLLRWCAREVSRFENSKK